MEHLSGLLPQALANLLRPSPTLDHGFKVPQQMRPAELPPPGGIPGVRTPAIRHQDAAEALAQKLLGDLRATRQADHEDGDPRGDGDPQPRAGSSFTPARLIEVCDGLRTDVGLGVGHRSGDGLHRRLFQMGNRPQTHREPEQVGHHLLGRPLRQAIRPRAQRHDGLDAWPKAPWRDPERQGRAGRHPTSRADQPVSSDTPSPLA